MTRIPVSTYRFQVSADFPLDRVEDAYERLRQAAELATGSEVTIGSTAPTTTVAPPDSTVDT